MSKNPLIELQTFGQSFWYDNISRDLIKSGELQRMIDEDGLRGVTSNPSIFYKAIKGSTDYDDQLRRLFSGGDLSEKEIFYELAVPDITDAADLLMPVYEESGGADGFVSMEVDPSFAYDISETVKEAEYLFNRINRKNLMIKVPATKEGLSAVKTLIGKGLNINVTLLFSVKRYEEVTDAYMRGLEERVGKGLPVDSIASVASFFVSRLDTLTDKLIEEKLNAAASGPEKEKMRGVLGKTAVANAKMAYQLYKNIFSSDRFIELKRKGAGKQRLLWGSTSTKNPAYDDLLYVDTLIGPGTINTMPPDTIRAFKDHGKVERTIDKGSEETYQALADLDSVGVDIDQITEDLEDEGVRLFKESFDSLMELIKEKRG